MLKGVSSIVTVILLLLVSLAAYLGFAMISGGQLDRATQSGISSISGALSFCDNKEPVDFAGFMAAMNEVYDRCNKDTNNCGTGKGKCETMTVKFDKGCYKIGTAKVTENVGEMFNNPQGILRLRCSEGESLIVTHIRAINAYGKGTNQFDDTPFCEASPSTDGPHYFAVADNSKVNIKAIKGSDYITLELKISGGDKASYNTCEYAPTKNCATEANPDQYCRDILPSDQNDHVYCNTQAKICTHQNYCQHVCESGGSDCEASNMNNPGKKKCVKVTISCDAVTGQCPSTTVKCPQSGIKGISTTNTLLDSAVDETGELKKRLSFNAAPPINNNRESDHQIFEGTEKYYKPWTDPRYIEYTDQSNSKELQMSLAFGEYNGKRNEVTLYQGCY